MGASSPAFLHELVAAQLALALGIPAAIPAVVEIEQDFADSIPDPFSRAAFLGSLGPNFGCEFKNQGYSVWPVQKPLAEDIRQQCLECFAFDLVIQNVDRRIQNPNLLTRSDELLLFDHEHAFSNTQAVMQDATDALEVKNLQFMKNHVFFHQLRQRPVDLRRMEGALGALTNRDLNALMAQVPPPWRTSNVGPILKYLVLATSDPTRVTRTVQELLA